MYEKNLKRILDIIISIVVFPFFLIILIIVAPLIKLEDKGPILYKSERIGKDFKIFEMYKLRTMKKNSPVLINDDGSTYNSKEDHRVTKIGKFLRENSIDETPQLINVLKGDMSLIGPRASLASVIDSFKDDEVEKMKVRPGITGYTQAYYRNGLGNREKRIKDAWYANKVNLLLDIKITLKTIKVILMKDNIYTN